MAMNKTIIYGLVGVAVLVILITVVVMMKKKEAYSVGAGGGAANTYTLISDDSGNLSTTYSTPVGGIMLWHGSPETVPVGWGVCDGSTYNGVQSPDLRNVFVLGAGGANGNSALQGDPLITGTSVDNNGGTGGANSITLTGANLPSHNHLLNLSTCSGGTDSNSSTSMLGPLLHAEDSHCMAPYTGYTDQDQNGRYMVSYTGGGEAFPNVPRYINLFYIMKYA